MDGGIVLVLGHRHHPRSKDIMFAAQAQSLGIPLMTRNAKDSELVCAVVEVLEVD